MNTNQTRDELFERHLQGELSDVEKEHVAELLDSDACLLYTSDAADE